MRKYFNFVEQTFRMCSVMEMPTSTLALIKQYNVCKECKVHVQIQRKAQAEIYLFRTATANLNRQLQLHI